MRLEFDAGWNFERLIKNTDEGIEETEMKIMDCEVNIKIGMGRNDDKKIFRNRKLIESYENQIKMLRLEKLLYQSIYINNNNSRLFPLLLSKYSTLLTDDCEFASELVNCDAYDMNTYMEVCKENLTHHEYIKNLCKYGEKK